MKEPKDYMNHALELARLTIGQTHPNPSVGAIVVKDERVVGVGTHMKPGEPHAEVFALQQAGDEAKDRRCGDDFFGSHAHFQTG